MKFFGVLVILAALGVGGYFLFLKPVDIPELTLAAADGSSLTTSALRGDKEALLMVFLLPQCPLAKFSAGLLADLYPGHAQSVEFVGLVFGDQPAAEKLRAEWQLPYPCYGLRSAPDPLAVNALIETIGFSHGTRKAVHGGTVLAVDFEHKLLFKLEQEEVKELADRLAARGL